MRLAKRVPYGKNTPKSALALTLGYTSENTFKRVTGNASTRFLAVGEWRGPRQGSEPAGEETIRGYRSGHPGTGAARLDARFRLGLRSDNQEPGLAGRVCPRLRRHVHFQFLLSFVPRVAFSCTCFSRVVARLPASEDGSK